MSLIKYLHSKARGFVVFLFAEIALLLLILSTAASCSLLEKWYGLAGGVLLMVAAVPFHWNGKKWKTGYLISYLLNSVGSGMSVSALFVAKDVPADLPQLLAAAIPAAGVLLLVYLMLQIFHSSKGSAIAVSTLLNIVLSVCLIVLWIMHGYRFYSFAFFCSLISLFYLCVFGITVEQEERSLLRDISFGSFGSFIILTVVVVFILSEGEILDGFEPDVDLGGKRKTKKRK